MRGLSEKERTALSPILEKAFRTERNAFLKGNRSLRGHLQVKADEIGNSEPVKPDDLEEVPLEISDTDTDEDDWIDGDGEDSFRSHASLCGT